MTAPKPMTRQELIELAALDALGLLDDYEASLYTRSFHHAPAAVQDELIELQAKITTDPILLSNEQPSDDLRERVLDYLNRQIELSATELLPLATIGPGVAAASSAAALADHDRDVIGRINFSSAGWRVATFVLIGVVAVMGYFYANAIKEHNTLARLALADNTDARLEQMLGPTVRDYIFSQHSMRIVFAAPETPTIGRAVLFFHEGEQEGLLVVELPRSDTDAYELTMIDNEGQQHRIARFASKGGVSGVKVATSALASTTGAVLQITGPDGLLLVST